MSINGYFFDAVESGGVYDRVYDAEDVTSYLNKIVGNGVFPNPSTQLQVTAQSGMTVVVAAGEGWIQGHKMINTATYPLTLDNADALMNRIDRVIFYADYTNRLMGIAIKKGTAAQNPTPPALTRDTTRYEMALADIRVNKQVTSITGGNITDKRADSSVCGWVAGLIQQVDTSTLFTQWQTAYSDYYEQMTTAFTAWETAMRAQFDQWLEDLTEQLNVDTYIVEYQKTQTITDQSATHAVYFDWTGYENEDTDIILVFINGLEAKEGVDYDYHSASGATQAYVAVTMTGSATVTNEVKVRVLKSKIGFSTT